MQDKKELRKKELLLQRAGQVKKTPAAKREGKGKADAALGLPTTTGAAPPGTDAAAKRVREFADDSTLPGANLPPPPGSPVPSSLPPNQLSSLLQVRSEKGGTLLVLLI